LHRSPIKDQVQERHLFLRRTVVAAVLTTIGIALLMGRLVFLQVNSHEHFSTLSDNNRVRIQPLPPTRGLIYDRNDVLLADNLTSFRLEVVPEQVENLEVALAAINELIPLDPEETARFQRQVRRNPGHRSIPLRLNLTDEEMARVSVNLHRLPGVHLRAALTRYYPLGERGVHLLGYVGRISEKDLETIEAARYQGSTHIGKNGVERAFEDLLHGKVGHQQVETNAEGRMLRVLSETPPEPGHDIRLTLDIALQQVAEDALGDHNGAVVALDPRNGDVLAMASNPGYDPNLFVKGIDHKSYNALNTSPDRPLFNRALRGTYPPGSTIKPFMALAGLEQGTVKAGTEIYCPGFYRLPNTTRRYRDWKRWGHGKTSLDKSIVQSCDVYYYDLARNLGIERMHDFLSKFGLGRRTGIDAGVERKGVLPNEQWKRALYNQPWYTGETLIAGIGQGFMLTTPLQLAQAVSILSSRGKTFEPHVLSSYTDPASNEVRSVQPTPVAPIELRDPSYWDQVIRAMTRVVHSARGTGRRIAAGFPYQIAGKTGTAQVFSLGQEEEYDAESIEKKLRDHALFIAFTPADDPRIAVAAVVENGGSGGAVAAPVVRKVLDAWAASEQRPGEQSQDAEAAPATPAAPT
jgi:penicillin-binding protein 2